MWDTGTWEPQEPDLDAAFKKGQIKMVLHGERLAGKWALIRLKSDRGKPQSQAQSNWLLIKEKDEFAVAGEGDALMEIDASVTTGRSLAEIAEGKKEWVSSKKTGQKAPPKPKASKALASTATKPPAFAPIQLCKVVDHPPPGAGWAHEIKFDGYRIQVAIGGGKAKLAHSLAASTGRPSFRSTRPMRPSGPTRWWTGSYARWPRITCRTSRRCRRRSRTGRRAG